MQLDKHPILWQAYNVCQAIEECGASDKLTQAVIKASDLRNEIEKLVDRIAELERKPVEGMNRRCQISVLREAADDLEHPGGPRELNDIVEELLSVALQLQREARKMRA
jgi:hypothetical protein